MDAVVILGLAGILTVPPWVALGLVAVQTNRTLRRLIKALRPVDDGEEQPPSASTDVVLRRFLAQTGETSESLLRGAAPEPSPAPVRVPAPQLRRTVPDADVDGRQTDPSEEMTEFASRDDDTGELVLDEDGNPPPVPR